jgi:hypothetical protein
MARTTDVFRMGMADRYGVPVVAEGSEPSRVNRIEPPRSGAESVRLNGEDLNPCFWLKTGPGGSAKALGRAQASQNRRTSHLEVP